MKPINVFGMIKATTFLVAAIGIVSLIMIWACSVPTELPPAGSYPLKVAQMREGTFWSAAGLRVVYVDAQHLEAAVKLPSPVTVASGPEDQLVVANGQATVVLKKDTAIDQSDAPGAVTSILGVVLILIVTLLLLIVFGQEPKKK